MQKTPYENYFVTDDGQVISLKWGKQRTLKSGACSSYGHQCVCLSLGRQTKSISVHRLIWESFYGPIPAGMEIDHIDRNPKNNTLSNLRLASRLQNARNCSGHKRSKSRIAGVTFHTRLNKWQASIRVNKKLIHLGYFQNEEQATAARKVAAEKYFAEFAPR